MSESLMGLSKELQVRVIQEWMEEGGMGTEMQVTRCKMGLTRYTVQDKVRICKRLGRCIIAQLRVVRGVCRSWLQAADAAIEIGRLAKLGDGWSRMQMKQERRARRYTRAVAERSTGRRRLGAAGRSKGRSDGRSGCVVRDVRKVASRAENASKWKAGGREDFAVMGNRLGGRKARFRKKSKIEGSRTRKKNRGVHGDVTEFFLMLCARWTHVG